MKRSNSRIKAMLVLYNYDLTNELINFDHLNYSVGNDFECDEEFFEELVNGVINNLGEINRIFSRNLKDWTFDRMSIVDRNLIRIGIYEMLYTETPKNIIINEILNITHEFSELDGNAESRFNNKVLDNVRQSIDGK